MGKKEHKLAEHYGLKVYLCLQHHTAGPMAVHNNYDLARLLQRNGQEKFEEKYSHEEWMRVFGRNYTERVAKDGGEAGRRGRRALGGYEPASARVRRV